MDETFRRINIEEAKKYDPLVGDKSSDTTELSESKAEPTEKIEINIKEL